MSSKDTLIKFGQKSCLLKESEAKVYYRECFDALVWIIGELESYLAKNSHFRVGKMMLDSWRLSMEEKSVKELGHDTIRTWKNY